MDGSRYSLQKLNNVNYSNQRFKVELLLVREELWRNVTPGEQPATLPAKELDAVWSAEDAKARATIGLLIEDNQHPLIRSSKTAKESWTALQNHLQKDSLTSKGVVIEAFSEGEGMAEYIFGMDELFSNVADAGQQLKKNLMVAMILNSLTSSNGTLIFDLESRLDDELSLEFVKRKLLDEAAKKQDCGSDSSMEI